MKLRRLLVVISIATSPFVALTHAQDPELFRIVVNVQRLSTEQSGRLNQVGASANGYAARPEFMMWRRRSFAGAFTLAA